MTAAASGTSEIPALLPYRRQLVPFRQLATRTCWVFKKDWTNVYGYLIYFDKTADRVVHKLGDAAGRPLDGTKAVDIMQACHLLPRLAQLINLPQAMFFVGERAGGYVLIDAQTALNKFASPGMLRDLFGTAVPTPQALEFGLLSPEILDAMAAGRDKYACKLVLKPNTPQLDGASTVQAEIR